MLGFGSNIKFFEKTLVIFVEIWYDYDVKKIKAERSSMTACKRGRFVISIVKSSKYER